MARSRNIKPGFFLNEDLGNIPPLGRLLFIGFWTVADFKGDLEWRPQRLKAQLLPYDDCDITELANNLELYRFIRYYSANGMAYIHINNFTVHQNPHINEKKNGSSIPAFCESLTQAIDLKELAIKTEQVPIKDVQLGKNTADSLILIPSSLIPDSSQDQDRENVSTKPKRKEPFAKPTLEEVTEFCLQQGGKVNPEAWYDHYLSNGWMVGKSHMKDWKACVRKWGRSSFTQQTEQTAVNNKSHVPEWKGYKK